MRTSRAHAVGSPPTPARVVASTLALALGWIMSSCARDAATERVDGAVAARASALSDHPDSGTCACTSGDGRGDGEGRGGPRPTFGSLHGSRLARPTRFAHRGQARDRSEAALVAGLVARD